MHKRPFYVGLKFSRELEADFRRSLDDSKVWIARVGLSLGLLLNITYSLWDYMVFETVLKQVTILRQVLASSFLVLAIGLTYLPSLKQRMNGLVGLSAAGYGAFFGFINTLEQTPFIFIANGTIISFFPFLFMAGSLGWAIGSSLLVSFFFLGIIAVGRGIDQSFVLLVLLDVGMTMMGIWFALLLEALRRREFLASLDLALERSRFRNLLVRILPEAVADRLQAGESVADRHERVVVLFADIVGFTAMSSRHDPDAIVKWLNELFGEFDRICDRHGLEKIKTIGDAYMAAHGLGSAMADCSRTAKAAIDMVAAARSKPTPDGSAAQIRVGLHIGSCHAGIIGERRFLYDLWGDTVNVASRMEAASLPNAVLVTDEVRAVLSSTFELKAAGTKEIKGRGPMNTWQLS